MKDKIAKLIDVKSIVTIILTLVFAYLSIVGEIQQDFMVIYSVIIAFYFGTQVARGSDGK